MSRPALRQATVDAPQLRFRFRVTLREVIAVGPGKVELLEAIREHGSITAAAKALGMSYRRAWLLLDEINHALKTPVIHTAQGGSQGGGATLTPTGETVIRLYREIETKAARAASREIAALMRLIAAP